MSEAAMFDFDELAARGVGIPAMLTEGLRTAAHTATSRVSPVQRDRSTLYRADGAPIGIGEYCQRLTPSWRWDWAHLQYVDQVLDRVTAGDLKRVIIQLPPRHGKSQKATVRFPVYRLELDSTLRVVIGCYNAQLARKFSRQARRLARDRIPLADDRTSAEEWETPEGGGIRAVGVGSGITGHGADLIVIDDPVKSREEADSFAYRERVWEWFTDDLYTRLEPGGAILLSVTRWHEDDLVGRILASEDARSWTVVKLPALAEVADPLGRQPGDALCPDRYNVKALKAIRRVLGTRSFEALYQQNPAPAEGVIFKAAWLRYYTLPNRPIRRDDGTMVPTLPERFDNHLQSWDMSFKDRSTSDFVCGQVWSRAGADCYLRSQLLERLDFTATIGAVLATRQNWPGVHLTLVEDKANGPAVISALRNRIPGLVAVEPEGDKVSRAHAVTPICESGNVWLPHPQIAPWVTSLVLSLTRFPYGQHDDDVDSFTQALRRLMRETDSRGSTGAPQQQPQLSEVAEVVRTVFGRDSAREIANITQRDRRW